VQEKEDQRSKISRLPEIFGAGPRRPAEQGKLIARDIWCICRYTGVRSVVTKLAVQHVFLLARRAISRLPEIFLYSVSIPPFFCVFFLKKKKNNSGVHVDVLAQLLLAV
jgi:hypothetical protein